jgi:4-carboxymuconolactone decarboxylase
LIAPPALADRTGRNSSTSTDQETMDKALFDKGLKIRREVVGDAYVDASLKNADDFSMPMQELVTEFCWGEVWSRPDLDRRSRSILNLGMIAALNRSEELATHIRGAINNGLTKEEIRECLLQISVYCGMPAGLTSFKIARQVFKEMGI